MKNNGIGSIILVENGKPVGIVTERDLVHRIMAEDKTPDECKAIDVCSKPVIAITIHGDVDAAVDIMNEYGIRRLVVVDDNDAVVGMLTTDDLAKNLREMSEELAVKYLILSERKR
jgi:CBS domain-containing protein